MVELVSVSAFVSLKTLDVIKKTWSKFPASHACGNKRVFISPSMEVSAA